MDPHLTLSDLIYHHDVQVGKLGNIRQFTLCGLNWEKNPLIGIGCSPECSGAEHTPINCPSCLAIQRGRVS